MSLLAALPIIGNLIDPVGRIGELIAKARLEEADAENEAARIRAQERVKTLEARQRAMVDDPFAPIVRFAFALPFVIYNFKLVFWDKIWPGGATDPLSPELVYIEVAVIGFYFLNETFRKRFG